jgi:hypothetical protein
VHAFHILQRVNRRLQFADVEVLWHRALDDDAGDARIGVQRLQSNPSISTRETVEGRFRSSNMMPAFSAPRAWFRT